MIELLKDPTFLTIVSGTALLGAMSGAVGCFAMLKQQSLMGDTIAHASLPGIVLAFLALGAKTSGTLLLGALLIGFIAALCVRGLTLHSRLKSDTALGIVLSVFFGVGIMLLTYVQKIPNAQQAGLERYLFGQASTLLREDIFIMIGLLIPILLSLLFFWKELKLVTFDSDFAKSLGIPVNKIQWGILLLIVLVIVLGLQTVGVVLMSSLLLAPAAAARQWTNSLKIMVFISAAVGALTGVLGTAISATETHLPTGPIIVLVGGIFVLISMLFSPKRGIIFKYLETQKLKINKKS